MTRAADLAKLIAGGGTITVADNSDTLTLESTDADANVGPVLNLHRNSASPADGDLTGRIVFKADDDAGNAATFARIEATAVDVSNGGEDGRLDFFTAKDDAFTAALSILGTDVGIGTTSPSLGSSANGMHITGASGNDGVLKLDSSDTSHSGKLQFTENGTDQWRIAYDPANNHLEFTESGVADRLVLADGGNVGIGTTSPSRTFHVSSSSGTAVKVETSDNDKSLIEFANNGTSTTCFLGSADDAMQFGTGGSERMRIDSNGALQIGGTSNAGFIDFDSTNLQLNTQRNPNTGAFVNTGKSHAFIGLQGVDGGSRIIFSTAAANNTVASERMRIHSGGGISINTTSITGGGFASTTNLVIQNATSGGECLGLRSTSTSQTSMEMVVLRDGNNTQIGTIIGNASANTTTYGTSSDYRFKENVVDVHKPIEKLKKLKPKTYNMISDPDNKLDGFMAHELGEVIPNAAHGVKDAVNEDGSIKPQQVDYGLITPLLTAALQEAVTKIETLEAKVATLESK